MEQQKPISCNSTYRVLLYQQWGIDFVKNEYNRFGDFSENKLYELPDNINAFRYIEIKWMCWFGMLWQDEF